MALGQLVAFIVPFVLAVLAILALRGYFAPRVLQTPVSLRTLRTRAISSIQHAPERYDNLRVVAIAVTVIAIFGVVLARIMAPPATDDFIVLVAPFYDQGTTTVSQTGRSAAERLVALLPAESQGRVQARLVERPPASLDEARTFMHAQAADALLWGEIQSGGMLDSETLLPQLAYAPTGTYAPNAWVGYTGRFALPFHYTVAERPINGAVVLPIYLTALANYADNQPDAAMYALTRLMNDYPALHPTLPEMLTGTLLWARGETAAAAASYQRAIRVADTSGLLPQAALLYNNLGAVLMDGGDLAAIDALNRATDLLNAAGDRPEGAVPLGELEYNRARIARDQADHQTALVAYQHAYASLPPSTALLLELRTAYRAVEIPVNDQGTDASALQATVSQQVEGQVVVDTDQAPADLRTIESARLRGMVALDEGFSSLAAELELRGPLLWGLQARSNLSDRALSSIRRQLDLAVDLAERRARGWSLRAASEDAAGRSVAGAIASQQARLAEHDLRLAQRWQAAITIEQGETQQVTPPEGLRAVWSGMLPNSKPLQLAQTDLEDLIAVQPRELELYLLLGHDLLDQGELSEASRYFTSADSLAPQRPEAIYGLALTRLADQTINEQQRWAEARNMLLRALERNSRYYPARMQLASIAEASGDWATAVDQRRTLANEQPGVETTLQLVRTLRQAGSQYYVEAQERLLPLARADNIDALLELATIYRESGMPEAQRQMLEIAQQRAPRNVTVAYELALLDAAQGDLAEAERQLRNALASDPKHIPSLVALARLYQDRPDQATDLYRQALDAGADDVAILRSIGQTMLEAERYDLALRAFSRAVDIGVDDAELQRGIAAANLGLKRYADADAAAERAISLAGGNDPQALIVLGQSAYLQKKYDLARTNYTAAVQQLPGSAQAQLGLGKTLAADDQWNLALGNFRTAMDAEPKLAEARLWYGQALLRTGDPQGASRAFQEALQLKAAYPEASFGLAQAALALGDREAADAALSEAIRQRPTYGDALLLRGRLYEDAGEQNKALELYTQAVAADRSLAEPHYRRALLLIRTGKLNDAEQELDTALAIQKIFPEATYWRGRVAYAKGQYQQALEYFIRADTQAARPYPEARYYRGLTEEQLGMREAARVSFQLTSEMQDSPWSTEARVALARLGNQ